MIHERIKELAQLQDGWLNGEGVAPNAAALQKLERAFNELYARDLTEPYLYPTPEGNVLAEWPFEHCDMSLDINLADFSAWFHNFRRDRGSEVELNLQLDPDVTDTAGWRMLNDVVRKIGAG